MPSQRSTPGHAIQLELYLEVPAVKAPDPVAPASRSAHGRQTAPATPVGRSDRYGVRLDQHTREIGCRGIAAARALLEAKGGRAA